VRRAAVARTTSSRLALRLALLPIIAVLPGASLAVHAYGVNSPTGIVPGFLAVAGAIEAETYRAEGCYANPARRKTLIDRLRHGQVIAGEEVRFRRKGGREITVLLSLCPVDENGTPFLEGQFVDISHRASAGAA